MILQFERAKNHSNLEEVTLSFKVRSELQALDEVLGYFEKINQPWITKKDWLQCQLALAEAFTNTVRHAHKGLSPELPVYIEISLTQALITMKIWDYGQPFPLKAFLQQNTRNRQELSANGHGLMILRQIADSLDYIRTPDNRNYLLIVKHFHL